MNQDNKNNDPDLQDFQCPILFVDYTNENYPITLPCGHTLSIKAFEQLTAPKICSFCQLNLPADFTPQKNILLAKMFDKMKYHESIPCSKHKEEKATAVCTKHKLYYCVDCVRNDQCDYSSVFSLEKLKPYLQNEAMKLNTQENEIFQRIHSNIQVHNDMSSLINLFLIDTAQREFLNQFNTQDLKQKQKFSNHISNGLKGPLGNEQIQALRGIESRYDQLEDFKAQEEGYINGANKIMKNKVKAFILDDTQKVSIDESLKEMDAIVNEEFCYDLEFHFKEGFKDRTKFFEKLEKFKRLESLSLQNLVAFEDFGAADLLKLSSIWDNLPDLHLDFSGMQKIQYKVSGLEDFFAILEKKCLRTIELSFKGSSFASEADLLGLADLLQYNEDILSPILNFENCEKATDEVIQRLLVLVKDFRNFSLNLLHCPHLTQETFQQLSSCLYNKQDPELNSKEFITLKLGHSQYISSSWLQSLGFDLRKMRISRLTLHFQASPEIEHQGVSALISSIRKIRCLKELDLSFVDCEKLENGRVIKDLGECVKGLKNLKALTLCIKECPKFNFDELENFRNEVKNVFMVDLDCPATTKGM